MEIKGFISKSYPVIPYFSGINAIEPVLLENGYAVVIDENDKFKGIFTPSDLIKKPHKIVIDCLTEKEHISDNENICSVINKFNKCHCPVLPVFRETNFIGIIKRENIIDGLRKKVDEFYDKSIISERLKHSFLTNLSHEIRTPLNGILGFLDILSELENEDRTIEGDDCRSIIKNSAGRFLLIMNDLVDLSLLHSGCNLDDVRIERVQIENIFSVLKEYFDTTSIVSKKYISVKYLNPDSSCVILSDGKKIKHILYHLIDNAIKFSNDNCSVIYGYKIEGDEIIFYVKNNCLPIPDDKREKIFEAFEKQDSFNNKLVPGIGIGLTLVKKLSKLLNGKVSFNSNEKLTTFYLTIPFEKENSQHITKCHM